MNKYLIEILKIQSSVILPGFGSLMITNTKTGKVSFNPHLKFNDGALAKFISEKEGIDQQEAQNQIAKFVREVEAELGKGNSYDMYGFGSFVKDDDGNITFKAEGEGIGEVKDSAASDKSKKADSKPAETKKTETKKEDKKEDKKSTSTKSDTKAKTEDKKNKAEADKKAKEANPAATSGSETKAEASKSNTEKDKSESAADQSKTDLKAPEVRNPTKKEESDAAKKENKYVPPTAEKDAQKDSGSDKGAASASSGSSDSGSAKEKALSAKTETNPADKKEDKSINSIKDKYKKSGAKDKKQKPSRKEKRSKTAADGEKKKKSKWPLIIILIILLGGGGTAGYLFKDDIMALINGEDKEQTAEGEEGHDDEVADDLSEIPDSLQEAHDAEEVIEDSQHGVEDNTEVDTDPTEEVAEDTKDEVVEDPPVVTSPGGNYHVIGNAFQDKSNATSYVQDMKNQGYSSAKILGQFDGLHMVSVQQFNNRSGAQSACGKVGGGAWVFKYPK